VCGLLEGPIRRVEPVEYTAPQLAFVVALEGHARLVIDVGGGDEVAALFDWVARPGILDELAELVEELRDRLSNR